MSIIDKKPEYWDEACKVLAKNDDVLADIIHRFSDDSLKCNPDAFEVTLKSVNGQQISVKAAAAIWGRLLARMNPLSPKTVIAISQDVLRSLGLSRQKALYFHTVAQAFLENPQLSNMDRDDYPNVAKDLLSIKGVGEWTVEMVGIFHFNYPDIFPISDLGLVRALNKWYDKKLTKKDAIDFSERWKPFRTVATWYFWRSLDPHSVQY